jgi:hypothetical protein
MNIPRCYQELNLEFADMPYYFVFTTHTPPTQEELIEEGYDEDYNRVASDFFLYVTEGLLHILEPYSESSILHDDNWLDDSFSILCSREIGDGWMSEYLIRLDERVRDSIQYSVLVNLLAYKHLWDK